VGHLSALTCALPDDLGVAVVARRGRAFPAVAAAGRGDLDTALDAVVARPGTDLYVSTAALPLDVRADKIAAGQRGGQRDAAALVAVYVDVDVADDGHAASNLPPTLDDARRLLEVLPPASMVVATGGGLHAWWLLDQPERITSDDDRAAARHLVRSWALPVVDAAAAQGWHVDNTGELARILRLCGTANHKLAHARPVVLDQVAGWPTTGTHQASTTWRPATTYSADELRAVVDGHALTAVNAAPTANARPSGIYGPAISARRSGTDPAPAPVGKVRPSDLTDGPSPLDVVAMLPWSSVWPPGWHQVGTDVVDGATVELWRRPGASSAYSAKCWPDACHVWSDSLPGLPGGTGYSKAAVMAWRYGITLSDLARRVRSAAGGRR
jgi:hypothetical protein